MTENYTKLVNLPPGWDVKFDNATGKCYYINYLTKVMQLEDPRLRYKQLQNERCSTESIPMQPMHGSPYHVYPTNNFPAVKAFQGPNNPSLQNVSASPLLSTKSQLSSAIEMSPVFRSQGSPHVPRTGNFSRRQSTQETSFTNQIDTDAVVTKIQNMFPTAGENHIRLLLKKYYNREAVVISALQVEKHPVTMPGPFATPPSQRHLFHANSTFHMTPPARRLDFLHHATTSRSCSPIPVRPGSISSSCIGGLLYGSPQFGEKIRNSPKPHSSPKMKLRYMKSIFPKADETLLLDILANSDNNVQKASEILMTMGYTKREVAAAPKLSAREEEKKRKEKAAAIAAATAGTSDKIIPLRPKELSDEEKNEVKARLQSSYKQIAEKIILMALESVNYSEDRAIQILQIVQQEDEIRARKELQINNKEATTTTADSACKDELLSIKESNLKESITSETLTASKKFADNDSIVVIIDSNASSQNQSSPPTPSTSHQQKQRAKSPIKVADDTSTKSLTTTKTISTIGNCLLTGKKLKSTAQNNSTSNKTKFNSKQLTPSATVINLQSSSAKVSPSTSSSLSSSSSSSTATRRIRDKSNSLKNSPKGSTDDDTEYSQLEFQSILGRITTIGHNNELAKGADDTLLLADYITWNGANPDNTTGHNVEAKGSNVALINDRSSTYTARGRNTELCKGPKIGLAKGSIYSQIAAINNIKCN